MSAFRDQNRVSYEIALGYSSAVINPVLCGGHKISNGVIFVYANRVILRKQGRLIGLK